MGSSQLREKRKRRVGRNIRKDSASEIEASIIISGAQRFNANPCEDGERISLSDLRRERWYWQNVLSSRVPYHIRTRRHDENGEYSCVIATLNCRRQTDKEKYSESNFLIPQGSSLERQCVSVNWINEKVHSSILTDILKKVLYIRTVVFRESFNLISRLHSTKFRVIHILLSINHH